MCKAMKKMMFLKGGLLVMLGSLMFATLGLAQEIKQKNDQVYLLTGEIKEGKIQAISADAVQFSYPGESLTYTWQKEAIHKFVFASGREEIVHPRLVKPVGSASYREKTVAVLPLFYIGDGPDQKTDEMRYLLQKEVYDFMSKNARQLQFQDPFETNALLLKSGVRPETMRQYTQAELAEILQVAYVITGTVTQEEGMINHYTHSTTTSSNRDGKDRDAKRNARERRHTNVHTTTTVEVKTRVDLAVFNNRGEKIYHDSKRSLLSTADAYRHALHYLLRRTPLYERQ
jgi:hypothetical protein